MKKGNSDWKEPDALIYAALLAAFLVVVGLTVIPEYVRARGLPSQITCAYNLRRIDGAKQRWAMETHPSPGAAPTWQDLQPYLGRGTAGPLPECPQGGVYTLGALTNAPTCSIKEHVLQ